MKSNDSSLLIWVLKSLDSILTIGRQDSKLSILVFHRVLPMRDPLVSADDLMSFTWKMRLLARHFNVLPLSEAIDRLQSDSLSPRSVCITFDDGYRDNIDIAFPVLEDFGLPATFFIAAGFLSGGAMFNDVVIESIRRTALTELDLSSLGMKSRQLIDVESKVATINEIIKSIKYAHPDERQKRVELISEITKVPPPNDLMMTELEVKKLYDSGMEIGAHTVTHPILNAISKDQARVEIERGIYMLKDICGSRPTLFAYPNGLPGSDYSPEHVHMMRQVGFKAAFTTMAGLATSGSDVYQLPRIGLWGNSPERCTMQLLYS